MGKSLDIMVVNLKTFVREKKVLLFLVGIPILYYSMMGFVFGSSSFGSSITYNIGFASLEESAFSDDDHPNYNLSLIYEIFDDMDSFNIYNYSSLEEAYQAAKDDIIVVYLVFPEGFEDNLTRSAQTHIGWYNGDTSTHLYNNITWFYDALGNIRDYEVYNITNQNFNTVLNSINDTDYDGLLYINDYFLNHTANASASTMMYYFRNGTARAKVDIIKSTIKGVAEGVYAGSNIEIGEVNISNAQNFSPPNVSIYFLQSVSSTDRQIITGIVQQVITGIINYQPSNIDLNFETESAQGRLVNALTFGTPGYILYGSMTILSFTLVVITSMQKEGIFKRLSSTELTNKEIILGSLGANIILSFFQTSLGLGFLFLFGLDPITYDLLNGILGVSITILLFSMTLSSLALMLAPVFKTPDAAGGGVWIVILPLLMFSGGFFPVEYISEEFVQIVYFLPTRLIVLSFQDVLIKGLPIFTPSLLINWGLQSIYIVAFFIIGTKLFNNFKK
jgi:hypothetical protein